MKQEKRVKRVESKSEMKLGRGRKTKLRKTIELRVDTAEGGKKTRVGTGLGRRNRMLLLLGMMRSRHRFMTAMTTTTVLKGMHVRALD